jgi:hypothetical protein
LLGIGSPLGGPHSIREAGALGAGSEWAGGAQSSAPGPALILVF